MSWAASLPLGKADEATAAKVRELAAPITAQTGVSLEAMMGRSHEARIARSRHRLYAEMWKAGFSLAEIGRLVDRDHTSVRAGVRGLVGPEQYKAMRVGALASRLGVAS